MKAEELAKIEEQKDVKLLLQKIEELQVATLLAEKQIHELEVFKEHANYLLPYFLYEHIEDETNRYLMLEKMSIYM